MYISNISLHFIWFGLVGWLVLCIEFRMLDYTSLAIFVLHRHNTGKKKFKRKTNIAHVFLLGYGRLGSIKIKRELRGQDKKHRHLVDFIIMIYFIFLKLFGEETLFRLRVVYCILSQFSRWRKVKREINGRGCEKKTDKWRVTVILYRRQRVNSYTRTCRSFPLKCFK
jgi:hypothetical protein